MKARSRQAPVRPAVSRPAHAAIGLTANVVVDHSRVAAPWEHWLDRQSRHLAPTHVESSGSTLAALVEELLAGRSEGLPFTPVQSPDALGRALRTPDLCLWNRVAGADLSALTADVIRRSIDSGLRVLYLAASPTPIERTLARLAVDPTFLAVRFSAPGERASNGPLTRFSLDEQRTALRVRLLARAAEARAELEVTRAQQRADAEVWEALSALVRDIVHLDARLAESEQRLMRLTDEVRREAEALTEDGSDGGSGPFTLDFVLVARRHRERLGACERTLLPLRDQLASLDRALAELTREMDWLDPLLAAYRAGKWWTISYWKARCNGPLRQHGDSVLEQQRALRASHDRIVADAERAEADRRAFEDARDAEVTSLVAAEVGRRHGEIESQLETIHRQRDELVTRWRQTRDRLSCLEDRPADPTLESHRKAFDACRARSQTDVVPPTAQPHDDVAGFLQRMPALAPVVAGTTLALARHAEFALAAKSTFDLVVVDDADRLGEDDLLAILARAPRALAIGSISAASPFAALWKLLHVDPSAYQWSRHEGGYLCTLSPLSPAEQPFVESERLADFPEIELRILSMPKQPPRLVQVVFPASLSAVQAKAFIYRELQEAAVDRVDRPKQFLDSADRFTIAWDCPASSPEDVGQAFQPAEPAKTRAAGWKACPTEEDVVELEPGLRETICVHDDQLTTCRLEFDKSAGWDQAKIHDWLRRHLPALDAPRTADLLDARL